MSARFCQVQVRSSWRHRVMCIVTSRCYNEYMYTAKCSDFCVFIAYTVFLEYYKRLTLHMSLNALQNQQVWTRITFYDRNTNLPLQCTLSEDCVRENQDVLMSTFNTRHNQIQHRLPLTVAETHDVCCIKLEKSLAHQMRMDICPCRCRLLLFYLFNFQYS